jgi:16S rRNA (guanine527-N7)-methyltransferase
VERSRREPPAGARPSWEVANARTILDRGLDELGLAGETARVALLELARLIDRWSARTNLTGHRGLEAIVRRSILDSAALVAHLPEIESLADLGSGAGFPGLPAAILRPHCRISLIEARERRHHFQLAACRALGIRNVGAVRGRAEELEPTEHAAVVAQALARPARALGLMLPWVEVGGLLVLPAGVEVPEIHHPHVCLDRLVRYRVPCCGPERSLWLGRRTT